MADVFEEVEEQLRSARYQTIVKKGWPYALGFLLAVMAVWLGVWAWNAYQLSRSAKASEAYQMAFDSMAANNGNAADIGFGQVASSGPKSYQALARMQQAGLRTAQDKTAEAEALFDQAASVAPDTLMSDAAKLKNAYLKFDTESLADLEAQLTPLAAPGRPFSALAREALAMKRMVSGQTAEARQAFALLAISPDGGQALQQRAQIAMGVIDAGQAGALPAVVKAAAALPKSTVAAAKLAAAQKAAAEQAAQQAAQAFAQAPPGAGPAPAQAGAAQ